MVEAMILGSGVAVPRRLPRLRQCTKIPQHALALGIGGGSQKRGTFRWSQLKMLNTRDF
jgi:hypothetical protein